MRKNYQSTFLTVLLILGLTLLGCTSVRGSGNIITKTYEISDFTRVSVAGIGKAIIEQTGQETLTLTTDDNLFGNISVEVTDGTLSIDSRDIVNPPELTYHVTVKDLTDVRSIDLAYVELKALQLDALEVQVKELSSVVAQGRVDRLTLALTDSGEFDGQDLASQIAKVSAEERSTATLHVNQELHARTSDGATVTYTGTPVVTADTGAGGEVKVEEIRY
jgi:hypothetical protein